MTYRSAIKRDHADNFGRPQTHLIYLQEFGYRWLYLLDIMLLLRQA